MPKQLLQKTNKRQNINDKKKQRNKQIKFKKNQNKKITPKQTNQY